MKRTALALMFVAAVAVAVVMVVDAANREAEYRRLVAQGESSLASDQAFLAIESFSGAIAIRPGSMIAYVKRGETYLRRGEYAAAIRDLRAAARLDPAATRPLELLGDGYRATDRYPQAADAYVAYLRLDDRAPHVLYKLALVQHEAGNTSAAITSLRRATALRPRFPEAFYLLGACLRERGRFPEATAALEQARALSPGALATREALAATYQRLGRTQDAISELEALAALEPRRAARQIAAGLAYATAGQHDSAVLTLRRVASQFPEDTDVYTALGRVWLAAAEARGDRVAAAKALEALNRVATAATASSETLLLFGRALALSGDITAAEQAFRLSTARFPVEPGAFGQLAALADRLGHVAIARDALAQRLALADDDGSKGEDAVRLAELSVRLDDRAGATAWERRALGWVTNDVTLLARLADVSLRVGDVETARTSVARGLEVDPRNARLLALRRRVEPR